jgi:hypothetical protein
MQDVTIVVGKKYRDLGSVQRFVARNFKNGRKSPYRAIHVRSGLAATAGDTMVQLAAARVGCPVVAHTPTSLTPGGMYLLNTELADASDWIVVFDDGSKFCENLVNQVNAQKKRLTHFRETHAEDDR